jgi:hypothetical protein
MKKVILVTVGFFIATFFGVAQIGSPIVKSTNAPNKDKVSVSTITFNYPAKDIETAVLEKLKKEGLTPRKAKSKFVVFEGVEYLPLWDNKFDFYLRISGSSNAGTIELLMTQGYNNYINPTTPEVQERVNTWLLGLEKTVGDYIYERAMAEHLKEKKLIERTLSSLQTQQDRLKNQYDNLNKQQEAFEKTRVDVSKADPNTLNTKDIAKQQKQQENIVKERNKLEYSLYDIRSKIAASQKDLDNRNKAIDELKQQKR